MSTTPTQKSPAVIVEPPALSGDIETGRIRGRIDAIDGGMIRIVLRELEGKSYEEIAEITDCNLGTVKSRLNRARNAFASIIEPWLD